jgi:thioesterase domain-containing protein
MITEEDAARPADAAPTLHAVTGPPAADEMNVGGIDSAAVHPAVRAAWERVFRTPAEASTNVFDAIVCEWGVLRAVRALAFITEVEAATGMDIPVTALHVAPTLDALSALLRDPRADMTARPVLLRAAKDAAMPPLFIIPGVGGTGFDMCEMIAALLHLGPLYMNVPCGLAGTETPLTTMASVVADHVAMMRRVQPHGPYFILGYSWGGQIGIEVARQLRAEHAEEVAFIGAIDPQLSVQHWTLRAWATFNHRRLRHHFGAMVRLSPLKMARYGIGRVKPLASRIGIKLGFKHPFGWNPYQQDGLPEILYRLWRTELAVAEPYRMPFYEGRVSLFFSRDGQAALTDPERLWRVYVRQVEAYWLDGDHMAMIRPPKVRHLAEAISKCVDQARRPR